MALNRARILIAGLFIGTLAVISSISLAALIFSGPLYEYLPYGINIALISTLLSGLITALMSSNHSTVAAAQDRVAPILAIIASSIIAQTQLDGLSSFEAFSTIVVIIVVSTFMTGLFLILMGVVRAGGLMRFIPYSVLGGFLAGTGWLLMLGGLRVMSGLQLGWGTDIFSLLVSDTLIQWLPGVLIAVAIISLSKYFAPLLILPVILLISSLAFYLVMINLGYNLEMLKAGNWLISSPQVPSYEDGLMVFWQVASQSNWSVIDNYWMDIFSVLIISAMSVIFSSSALEMVSGKDVDVDKELRVAGFANIANSLGGAMPGFVSLSFSKLVTMFNATGRSTGIIVALMSGIALMLGADFFAYIPRFIVGSLLIYMGLSFLKEWLLDGYSRLSGGEYGIVLCILLVIATTGFVEGLFTGLLAALFLFVINYSKVPVVRYDLTGADTRSAVERSFNDDRLLNKHGKLIKIKKLRGYLFFGSMVQVINTIMSLCSDEKQKHTRYVLLDFSQVSGLDSSTAYQFHRLQRLTRRAGITLVLTEITASLKQQLFSSGIFKTDTHIKTFDDVDHGLEWCENELLTIFGSIELRHSSGILEELIKILDEQAAIDFKTYLDKISFEQDQELIQQNTPSDSMLFLHKGEVSVYLINSNGEKKRVRRTGSGTVIGELGFYLGTPRSASVISDTPGIAYKLSSKRLEQMNMESPQLASELHKFMANLMAERLLRTTNTLKSLME